MTNVGRILFLCPDVSAPTGGVQKIYEFAQALNAAEINSMIVHLNPNYRPTWFKSNVPVIARRDTVVQPQDILVVPEFMASSLPQLKGCAKIILNQNLFSVYDEHFLDSDVVSIVCVSEYIRRYSEFAYHGKPTLRIVMGFDKNLFYSDQKKKKKQIAYMPRKRTHDSRRVLDALQVHGLLTNWTLVRIDGMNSQEVAQILRESMIFLSFSEREGFGLPPLEAMASGCLVVGFHGHGGSEFFDPAYCFPIPEDDLCSFQETLEMLLVSEDVESLCHKKGAEAAQVIASTYSMQKQCNDVVESFKESMTMARKMKGLRAVRLGSVRFGDSSLRRSARYLKKSIQSLIE